jgi:hypothetical protein
VSQKTKNINKNIKNKNPQKQKQKNFLWDSILLLQIIPFQKLPPESFW